MAYPLQSAHPRSHLDFTTHPSLHIRDARDAHIILEAVRLNIIPLITRRLSSTEREQLCSGNVFVWEEAEFKGGLERWTDGRRWSQSRMRGDYLFYEEKLEATQEERDLKAARRARRALDPLSVPPLTNRRQDRPSKPNGLTKQTFSTQVYLPGASAPRKWHIVAYFSGNDYTRLYTIDDIEQLRNIRVPHGIYVSSKGSYKRADTFPCEPDDDDSVYSNDRLSLSGRPGSSPSSSSVMAQAYMRGGVPTVAMRPHSPLSGNLPRLSSVVGHAPQPVPVGLPGSSSGRPYAPRSAEDRRVLNTFRIAL
ncbi:Gti1/Pac2 family-domain-containing protein [Multifurca ochricompacta]|uniref:Gti1/Pac2 family-domain-containing protein n=1 Tax=Multifurca ochricompacta TaxID=376703 RepID=A0AAD4LYL3_9AGAM|nr:Gti1/Pac2 family-domain-containing protein [Multifurca ochricompacta]